MKTEYIVGFIDPFKRKIKYHALKTEEEVQELLKKGSRKFQDHVVIRKDIDNDGVERITLEKKGYGVIYVIINKLFIILTFMLFILISYLYFKYLKPKN